MPSRIYNCSTARRKPGVCSDRLGFAIDETDALIIDQLEGAVLSPTAVEELLALVEHAADDLAALRA